MKVDISRTCDALGRKWTQAMYV